MSNLFKKNNRIIVKISTILLILQITLISFSSSFTNYTSSFHFQEQEPKQFKYSIQLSNLTPHNPIFIDSDEDFITYGFSGNGSADTPYIIENYIINSTYKNYGVRIQSTTKFFVIRNCFIGNCFEACILIDDVQIGTASLINNICKGFFVTGSLMSQNHGIFITNSSNTTVEHNICRSNSRYGIYILESPNSTVRNCITDRNDQGSILLENSQNSVVEDTISARGIKIVESAFCSIKNNTCTESAYGIYLRNSDFCEILDNNIKNTYDFGIKLKISKFCEIRNNSCYRFNTGIKLVDSLNISVEDNYLQNCINGIVIKNSINSTLLNNKFRRAGISFEKSSDMTFETTKILNNSLEVENEDIWQNKEIILFKNLENYVLSDTDYGQTILYNCSSLTFDSLYFPDYGVYELEFYHCEKITFSRNTVKGKMHLSNTTESRINSNEINSLRVEDCLNIVIEDNNIVRVELYRSSQITVQNNTNCLESNGYNVYTWLFISKCHQLNIISNICQKIYCAIFARHSTFLEISRNNLTENYGSERFDMEMYPFKWFIAGGSIELFNASKSLVVDNNLTEGSNGVRLLQSCDNLVANNSIEKCSYGIYSFYSNYNNITDNIIKSNFFGIYIDFSNYESIKNNTIKGNKFGIYVSKSNYSDITYNLIDKNENGIALIEECNNNNLMYNIIKENELGIYLNSKTKGNIIHHNYIINNTQQAIDNSGKNIWYEISTEEGNYWSDHNSKKSYKITGEGEAIDPYPLNENLVRIRRASFINIWFLVLSLLSLIAVKKKKKRKEG